MPVEKVMATAARGQDKTIQINRVANSTLLWRALRPENAQPLIPPQPLPGVAAARHSLQLRLKVGTPGRVLLRQLKPVANVANGVDEPRPPQIRLDLAP